MLKRDHDFGNEAQNQKPIYYSTLARKWIFSSKWDNFSNFLHKLNVREMGRLDDREENETLTNLRESCVTFENRGL